MKEYDVIIIGSGFSGICSGIKLLDNGINNFLILERDEELGGTWWRNSYPGAAVDVPSHLYSFSFESFDWTRLFAKQEEILAYTKQVIHKHRLEEKARCQVTIEKLVYDQPNSRWAIHLANQEIIYSQFIISGTGSLSQPSIPKIPGLNNFKGQIFHSSRWDNKYNHEDKKIAVIGTGASAVQLIPELAKKAKHLSVIQRTAHWILPRPDRPLKKWERMLLKRPFFNSFFRTLTYIKSESRAIFFIYLPKLAKLVKLEGEMHLKKQIKNDELRQKLTPNYDIGCKRILLTNDYYPAFNKSNVDLITQEIDRVNASGIKFKNDSQIDVDLIVLATGFHAAENAIPFEVIGKNKKSLNECWKDGAYAYYGTMVSGFPNFFFAMGPNTGTGHTSVIYFIESQMNYIMDAILKTRQKGWKSVEIKAEVERQFNLEIQEKLKHTIWQKGGCQSWYLTASGKNTTMFPGFSFMFRKNTSSFKEDLHTLESA